MEKLQANPVIFMLLNGLLYLLYGLLLGLTLIPAICLIGYYVQWGLLALPYTWQFCIVLAFVLGIAFYLFVITGLIVFGLAERLLSLGFKPGRYPTNSPLFVRWLVYSGVHILSYTVFLPFMQGSDFAKLYYRIIGCKVGKNVFINTVGLHDAYLLELGDNVVIGGKTDITCHIFENGHLLLDQIKIGDDVLVGANCYITPGVTIGDRCEIGANSLLRKGKEIESGSVMLHLPSLPVRQLSRLLSLARDKERVKN